MEIKICSSPGGPGGFEGDGVEIGCLGVVTEREKEMLESLGKSNPRNNGQAMLQNTTDL